MTETRQVRPMFARVFANPFCRKTETQVQYILHQKPSYNSFSFFLMTPGITRKRNIFWGRQIRVKGVIVGSVPLICFGRHETTAIIRTDALLNLGKEMR